MPSTTTRAILLKTYPYRETSAVLHCYTEALGLVHVLAKGVNRPGHCCVERGMLLEMEVYHKPQRELHTAAQIMPCDYYLNVRSDLEKSALRDAIFEIVIKSVGIHDRQPALYRLLSRYLSLLDAGNNTDLFPCSLWKFLYHLYSILGIEMSFSFCAHCTAQQSAAAALYVNYAKGGIVCSECNCESQSATIPAIIREYCMEKGIVPSPELTTLDPAQKAQITDTFVNYWRYYFDISQPGPAVRFLCSLLTP